MTANAAGNFFSQVSEEEINSMASSPSSSGPLSPRTPNNTSKSSSLVNMQLLWQEIDTACAEVDLGEGHLILPPQTFSTKHNTHAPLFFFLLAPLV